MNLAYIIGKGSFALVTWGKRNMYYVVNKYTGRTYYKGTDKAEAKNAYRADPTGAWVYKDGRICDCRSFEPKKI